MALNLGGRLANWIANPSRIVPVSQRDRLGSVSHASRRCASGSNGTIDVPVVVQRKGVGVDGTEGGAFWGILTKLPGSRTGLARGVWGGMSSPNRTLLATGKMGRGREWGGRASHTVVPWTWEPGRKGNCSRAKSVAVRSSCINPGSVLPSCTCLSALAWWTCRIAMACRAEAAWPAAL